MNRPPPKLALVTLAAIAALSGTGCRWNEWFRRNAPGPPPPIAFSTLPTRDEALAAINANSQRIQSLQTQGATVSIPGAPAIGAEIAVERPRKLRFRSGTNLLGPELDLGSNDELFWFWAARAPGSSVYFARHEHFASSPARQMLAIEPAWLIEALGIVEIDPATVTEGPLAGDGDRVQLRTTLPTSAGQFSRLLVFDKKYAWVLEQHVYDERGQLVASSRTSQHEYQELDGVSLPRRIEVQIPQGQLRFQLDVARWGINQPAIEGQALFDLPRTQLSQYPFVDLADPNFVPPGQSVPVTQPAAPRVSQIPTDDYQQRIRGMSQWR